jgi:small subunit ribosomal protein S17
MPRKKKEDELEIQGTTEEVSSEETAEDTAVEAASDENAEASTEEKPEGTLKTESDDSQSDEATGETSIVDSVVSTVSSVVSDVAGAVTSGVSAVVAAVTPNSTTTETDKSHHSKRAEKIGIVQSDKMTKTVTVRVDRVVKHPVYRKYIKRRKKFMAHDELGATIGDKVRIMETRPLSARKRWRVVEIVQKAEK